MNKKDIVEMAEMMKEMNQMLRGVQKISSGFIREYLWKSEKGELNAFVNFADCLDEAVENSGDLYNDLLEKLLEEEYKEKENG